MKQYYVLDGVTTPAAAEKVEISSDGQSLGFLGNDWAILVDSTATEENKVLNRVSGNALKNNDVFNIAGTALDFPNTYANEIFSDVDINANENTIFGVIELKSKPAAGAFTLITSESLVENGSPAELVAPSLTINNDGKTIGVSRRGALSPVTNQSILHYEAKEAIFDKKLLITLTFSTSSGYKLWINGEQVAVSPDQTRPLTVGTKAGEFRLLRGFTGKCWALGLINRDLSKSDSIAILNDYFMKKYNI